MKNLFTRITVLLLATLLVLPLGSAVAKDYVKKTYSQQELDTMMAPVALYPDSLLSQILMASTYPGDVTEAVAWSKKNTKKTGDDAVKAVQDKSWDPSVMSLVAFPSVLDMMGQEPDWVEDMGNAFLSDSDKVMDTVQSLRKKAKDEGNLKSSKEQKVEVKEESGNQVIIIEPSDPTVVYVPTYNPTVIYGTWWWPSYTPYYYRPVGYGFGTGIVTGIGFGIGIGITNSLWGGFNWGHHSVDINVNRHNNINVNRNKINASSRSTSWQHNSSNINSVNRTSNFNKSTNSTQVNRQKASDKINGSDKRTEFRGRDADRDKARATLESRGVDPAKGRQELKGAGGSNARDNVSKANRDFDSGKRSNFDSSKVSSSLGSAKPSNLDTGKISNMDASRKNDFSSKKSSFNDNAFSDVGNPRSSHSNISRGSSSNRSFQNSGGFSRGGGGGMSRGGGRRR